MINRKELKEKVPYGYGKIIAQRVGVTQKCVYDYLSGKSNSERIEQATLEVVAELAIKKKKMLAAISY